MIFYILSVVILLKIYFLTRYFSRRKGKNCFTPENFDKVLEYTKWKQRTSKIGKVLVDEYRVEVSPEEEILFKKDNDKHYTLFKINREDGIILLAIKHQTFLQRKAHNAFCELLERALFHPVVPKES
jgi:hypothetical protein